MMFTLVSSLNTPVLFLINRPFVYEAAIISAQFFLILGIYTTIRALTSTKLKSLWLIFAGFSLSAAIASRFTYIFSVLFICFIILFKLLKSILIKKEKWTLLLSFAIPVVLIGTGLAWFNFVRFGNILESGLRYQLTGDALPDNFRLLFSPIYFAANTYSSLFRPLGFSVKEFPFFFSPYVLDKMWPNFIHRPPTYYSGEPVVGVFASIPFLWSILFPIIMMFKEGMDWINEKKSIFTTSDSNSIPKWVILLLSGTGILLYVTLMFYVMSTMRFLVDFVPLWMLCAGISSWHFLARLGEKTGWKRVFLLTLIILCAMTIIISLFLNMQSGDKRFLTNNPSLYYLLAHFFTR